MTQTIAETLKQAKVSLPDSPTATLDIEVLLSHLLSYSRAALYVHSGDALTSEQLKIFQSLLTRRQQGEPIAYITGHREFWSLDLMVNMDVLIPRPETELLVEETLRLLPRENKCHILELGTGSGAIALALAKECPHWEIMATDFSVSALAVAKQNAQKNGLSNVTFLESDWCNQLLAMQFNLIVSNPPYIAEQDPHLLQGDVRFEPQTALISGSDGLEDIRLIAQQAKPYLLENGYLLLEHGYDQAKQVKEILSNESYRDIVTLKDLSELERITKAVK